MLFENYLYKRSGDEELREISDIEIETLIKSSKVELDQKPYVEWEALIREGTQFFLPSVGPALLALFGLHGFIEITSNS